MRLEIIAQGSSKLDRQREQWGLSVLIDDDVLFDTFANGPTLEKYFHAHRIHVGTIRHIIISHDHWDHTGGLWWVLEQNRDCAVYVCRKTAPALKERIIDCGARLVEVERSIAVKEGVHTTGEIDGVYAGTPIVEQALLLRNRDTLAVVTGCSHPGLHPILVRAGLLFQDRVDMILGGLHLMNTGAADLEKMAVVLQEIYRVRTLAPCHCTGAAALAFFKNRLPQRTVKAGSGDVFRFNDETLSWEQLKS
jgi:7,8-dihydropterin-6-yl-methyl-4-(beta-D-ribofuranosyl)aminobenzene 5'-phosphate synthase